MRMRRDPTRGAGARARGAGAAAPSPVARRRASRALVAALAVLGAAATASAQGPPLAIGLDGEHGFDASFLGRSVLFGGSDYDSMRAEIGSVLGSGSISRVGDDDPSPSIDFEALDPQVLGAVMLKIPYADNLHPAFTSAEMAAIQAYVAGGGGLFLLAEGGAGGQIANFNALAALVVPGASFSDPPVECDGAIAIAVRHPMTTRVKQIGVDCHRPLLLGGSAATDLTASGPKVLAVLGAGGAGTVVLLSDSTLWKDQGTGGDRDITTDQNRLLLNDALRFVFGLPAETETDADGDEVDDDVDNCTLAENASQLDADGDGCGNACDWDFDQDFTSGSAEFNVVRACMAQHVPGTGPADDPTCAESDMDGNLAVGAGDFNLLRTEFGNPPGPGAACF